MPRINPAKTALILCSLMTVPAGALAQDGGELAGVAAAVRGDVTLVAALPATGGRVVGKNLGSGDRIFLGDEIETGPESGMQIMLLDETIFTIGPSSGLIIDEFVYDPATSAGKVTASVVKGAFRFVSGRVAKEEPSNMNVRTPVGTIGIRGTSAAGVISPADPNDPASPLTGTFVLLGPGVDNNAGERAGRILVTNGGTTVEITRSGFGTVIASPILPPGTPVRLEPAQVAGLTAALGTDGGARPQQGGDNTQGSDSPDGGGSGGSRNDSGDDNQNQDNRGPGGEQANSGTAPGPNQQGAPAGRPSERIAGVDAGQVAALTGQNLGSGATDARFLGRVGTAQNEANQQVLEAAEDAGIASTAVATAISTFDQLRLIQTGTATFDMGNISLNFLSGSHTNSGGSYNANAVIDFGAQTIDLNISSVTYFFNGGNAQSFAFDPDANTGGGALDSTYANDSGFVAETWTTNNNAANFTTAPTDGASVQISAAILNDVDAGVIAARGFVTMRIQENGGDTVIGGSGVAERQ